MSRLERDVRKILTDEYPGLPAHVLDKAVEHVMARRPHLATALIAAVIAKDAIRPA